MSVFDLLDAINAAYARGAVHGLVVGALLGAVGGLVIAWLAL